MDIIRAVLPRLQSNSFSISGEKTEKEYLTPYTSIQVITATVIL